MLDMKYLFLVMVAINGATASAFAQQMKEDTLHNGIIIEKDYRLALLEAKKAEINKKAADARKPVRGFRIQVLNTTNRNEVLNAKARLLSLYPEHKTYLLYQAPYFKLRIGNFTERAEAEAFQKELSKIFTTGIFVIPSEIEVKPAEKEDKKQPAPPQQQ